MCPSPLSSLVFRPARPTDAEAAVPLIHSSGPAAFDYVFGPRGTASALAFLHHAFRDGEGEFGWRNHHVGELDHRVVAVGAAYGGEAMLAFTLAAARQILGHFGLYRGTGVILRGLRTERVIPPPGRGVRYLAHLGVAPGLRGQGIGRALIAHLTSLDASGTRRQVLDVSVENPRAQALYDRLGFVVTGERASRLAAAHGSVPGHRTMQRPPGAGGIG